MTTTDGNKPWLDKNFKPLRLQKLPYIVFERAARLMDPPDRLKLSFTSKKTECLLNCLITEKTGFRVIEADDNLISISENLDTRDDTREFPKQKKLTEIQTTESDPSNTSMLQTLKNIYPRIEKLFPSKWLFIRTCGTDKSLIKDFLSCDMFSNWAILISGGAWDQEMMQFVINRINRCKDLELSGSANFAISNAAPYIRVEDVLAVRGLEVLAIERSALDSADIHRLLMNIVFSGYCASSESTIVLKEEVKKEVLLKDFLALEVILLKHSVFLVLMENVSKPALLGISCDRRRVYINVILKLKNVARSFQVLEVLHQKKKLELKVGEDTQRELDEIDEQLDGLGVTFGDDGRARIHEKFEILNFLRLQP